MQLAFLLMVGLALPAMAETGEACLATEGEGRALCVAMIGALRALSASDNSDPACATTTTDDQVITEGVIDWIKSHPERQNESLAMLVREALFSVDPCTQNALTLQAPAVDPLGTE